MKTKQDQIGTAKLIFLLSLYFPKWWCRSPNVKLCAVMCITCKCACVTSSASCVALHKYVFDSANSARITWHVTTVPLFSETLISHLNLDCLVRAILRKVRLNAIAHCILGLRFLLRLTGYWHNDLNIWWTILPGKVSLLLVCNLRLAKRFRILYQRYDSLLLHVGPVLSLVLSILP